MVKHSNLAYKELLGEKMTEYLMHSRTFGRDIQSMQAQGKGVIDNLITYNTVTLRKLSNVENGKTSRQELRLIYEASMGLIGKFKKKKK
ncbi:uncharacterized protein BX664DRAFT_267856 [Halteromyces radiatus]|uniref:uncharacterized protein n=1 Tax=Halteromyces radiatus TaxID=101107 RepID=UPI0022203385|nr:uncharacterized protein BX664DRAFT_267856 [Halteromyces radiatus]KAI8083157.1 hypothetical protein BX664DRAFT_267856 [Halteromyces radiatus]